MNELHLFAGAGGGILGGQLLGHTCVCAVEIEPYCQRILLQRQRDGCLSWFPIWDDVRTFDGRPWKGKVDIVSGGFPCQDISSAGKGAGITGKKSNLWSEMARVIGEVRPRFAFVENSPLLTKRGFGMVLGDLAEMGYDARWGVIGAHHVGAPHKRERIWIVACSDTYSNGHVGGTVQNERRIQKVSGNRPSDVCKNVADTNCQAKSAKIDGRKEYISNDRGTLRDEFSTGSQDVADTPGVYAQGLSDGQRPIESGRGSWWATEPNVGRVAHGVAARVDRLKAIGNGQVPGVAALAWRILSSKFMEGSHVKKQATFFYPKK